MAERTYLCIGGESDGDRLQLVYDAPVVMRGLEGRRGTRYRVHAEANDDGLVGVLVPEALSVAEAEALVATRKN